MGNTTLTTSRALTRFPEEPGRAPRVTRLLCPWVAEPANRWDLGNHHGVAPPSGVSGKSRPGGGGAGCGPRRGRGEAPGVRLPGPGGCSPPTPPPAETLPRAAPSPVPVSRVPRPLPPASSSAPLGRLGAGSLPGVPAVFLQAHRSAGLFRAALQFCVKSHPITKPASEGGRVGGGEEGGSQRGRAEP